MFAQCLKITEKVSFNIASEASYVYILSGQKLMDKNCWKMPKLKTWNFKCDILSDFQTMCVCLVKSIDPFSSPASSS